MKTVKTMRFSIHRPVVAAGAAGALLLAATACGSSAGSTGSGGEPSVSIMSGGLSKQIDLPLVLAERLGYYKKVGLKVSLDDEQSGEDAATQMLAGKVDGTGGFYDHTIALQGKGQSVEQVVSLLQAPGEVELCRSDLKATIKSPAAWKGRRLGVTDFGSSTDFLTQFLATKNGVPPSDTTRVAVAAGATFISALQRKSIDCGMTTEPTVTQALQGGTASILEDLRTSAGSTAALGGPYPAESLYMTTSYINSHKDAVQKLVSALVSTLHWIHGHSAAQITAEMPADYYAGVGKNAYISALQNELGMYNPTGMMPAGGPQTCLAVLSRFNPDVKGHKIDLGRTYTDTFVQHATIVQ